MPTTRRTTRSADGVLKQATLSFNHRVTKPVPKSAKDAVVSDKDATPVRPSPLSEVTQPDDEPAVSPTEEQAPDEPVAPTPVSAPAPVPAPEQSEAELEAGRITDARIAHYLRGIEAQRLAKPVHQEELGVGEKVLRHFDVSSQYGVSYVVSPSPVFPPTAVDWR